MSARGIALAAVALVACAPRPNPVAASSRCPEGAAFVEPPPPARPFCIDRYEASLVEETPEGERPFSPFARATGHKVRAVSKPGVVPQAYISRNEAAAACRASNKRLCEESEWLRACEGSAGSTFPYGNAREPGRCNDDGRPPLASLYPPGTDSHSWEAMNDPRLNQLPGTLARTGAHPRCESAAGAYDMMGNVHEWVADPDGTFLGGYYLDTKLNGNGCHYKTVAHDAAYHDYSTGFRCCADPK